MLGRLLLHIPSDVPRFPFPHPESTPPSSVGPRSRQAPPLVGPRSKLAPPSTCPHVDQDVFLRLGSLSSSSRPQQTTRAVSSVVAALGHGSSNRRRGRPTEITATMLTRGRAGTGG